MLKRNKVSNALLLLRNNTVALVVYGFSVLASWVCVSAAISLLTSIVPQDLFHFNNYFHVAAVITALLCFVSGRFIEPTKYPSILSVLSVPAGLTIVLIFLIKQGGEAGFVYYIFSPFAMPLLGFSVSDNVRAASLYLSSLIPALMMLLGFKLRS